MAPPAQGFVSNVRSNQEPGAVDRPPGSSCQNVYLRVERPLVDCQDSLCSPPSRVNGCQLSVSPEGASPSRRDQQISQQLPIEKSSLAAAKGQRCSQKPAWNYVGTSGVRIAPPGARLDSRGLQNNGCGFPVSRPLPRLFDSDCFLSSTRGVTTGTQVCFAEYMRPAFLRPAVDVHGKIDFSPRVGYFPPVSIIPSCFYPKNLASVHASGTATQKKAPAYRIKKAEAGVPRERLHADGTHKEVGGTVAARAHAMLPGRLEYSSGLAVGFAPAAPSVNTVNSTTAGISDHNIITSNYRCRRMLASSAEIEEPAFSSVAASGRPDVDAPIKRAYTVLLHQSHVEGSQQMQVTASFAVPGATFAGKVPLAGRTSAVGSAVPNCLPVHCRYSSTTLRPSTHLLASRNDSLPAALSECERHCSPMHGGSWDCNVPSIMSLHARQHVAQVGAQAVQQQYGFLEGQQPRCQYVQGTFQTAGVPASELLRRSCYSAPRYPQKLNNAQSSPANSAGAGRSHPSSRLQPFSDHCVQSVERQGEAGNIRQLQHPQQHQRLQQFYRRRRQQSASGLQFAVAVPERGNATHARCGPEGDVRVMQRSRSHPPKASSSHSSTAETASTFSSTQNRGEERANVLEFFRASNEEDGKHRRANAVGLENHCMVRCSQPETFNAARAQVLAPFSAAFSPLVPSASKQCHYEVHKAAREGEVLRQDQHRILQPEGHARWRQVPATLRPRQLQRPSDANEHADGFAAEQPSGSVFPLPPSLRSDFPAEAGVPATTSSPAAMKLFPAVLTPDCQPEPHEDIHFHGHHTELPFPIRQEQGGFSCGEADTRGDEAQRNAAASSSSAPTTSAGFLQCVSNHSNEKAVDRSQTQLFLPCPQKKCAQHEVDTVTCSVRCQSTPSERETRVGPSTTIIERKPVHKREGIETEGKQQKNADIRVEAGFPTSPQEHKISSQSSEGTSRNRVRLLRRENDEKQPLTTSDSEEDRSVLTTEDCGNRKSDQSGTMKVSSEGAPEEYGPTFLPQESDGSDCMEAGRRRRSSCQGNQSVPTQWVNGHKVGLHFSAACCYSRSGSTRDHENHEQTLPSDLYANEPVSAKELDATSKLTQLTQTLAKDNVHRNEVTITHRIVESRNRKSNANKSDAEGKGNGLPWKSVIVNTKNCRVEKALINTCAQRLGWGRNDVDAFKGHIVWLGGSAPDFEHLHYNKPIQVINRFPGMWDMTKKRMLYRILSLYGQLFPKEYDFFPACWSLPEDRVLIEQMLHGKNKKFYILKPDGGARGNGVQLVSLYKDIDPMVLRGDGSYIMQKYVEDPYLLNKKKFDFRIYCVLFSVGGVPKAYVSKLGMVRFCTEEYQTPSRKNIDNPFMHLTNYSINKDNLYSFVRSTDLHDDSNSKRLLNDVFEELAQAGVDVDLVWQQIMSISAKTVVCLQPWLNLRYRHIYRGRPTEPSRCFQLLGLDILLDKNSKCWLLEVNSNPSLRIDYFDNKYDGIDVQLESAVDRHIKEPVVTEALALAYRVLLQQRQPYVQPLPRCCSRNKQSWYLRKPVAATVRVAGKQKLRSRSQTGRSSARSCCTGSEEEETEVEETAAAGTDTCAGRPGRRGQGGLSVRGSKARALVATSLIARRKVGESAAVAGRQAVEGAAAARGANPVTIEKGAAAETGGGGRAGMKKGGFATDASVEDDGRRMAGTTSNDSDAASSKQTVPVTRLTGQQGIKREEKEGIQGDSRSSESATTARSAESLQRQRLSARGKRNFRGEETSNSRKNLGHPNVERVAVTAHGGRGPVSEGSSCLRLRASSAAIADRIRRKDETGGCCTPAVPRGARTKSRNRRNSSINGALGKHAEEENEEYSDMRICISPARAVEEARKLLERLGPATVVEKRALEENPLFSPGSSRHSEACMQQFKATHDPAARGHPAYPCANVATPGTATSPVHCLDSRAVKTNISQSPALAVGCLSSEELEGKDTNPITVPQVGCVPLSPAGGAEPWPTISSDKHKENNEAAKRVRAQQSVSGVRHSGGENNERECRMRSAASMAAEKETAPVLHSLAVPTFEPDAIQESGKGNSRSIDCNHSPAAAVVAKRAAQLKAGTQESEENTSRPADGERLETVAIDALKKNISVRTFSREQGHPTKASDQFGGTTACIPSRGAGTSQCGTADDLEHEGPVQDMAGSPHRPRSSDSSESGCDRLSSTARASCTLTCSSSFVSSYPPSPSSHSETSVSEDEVHRTVPTTTSADPATTAAHSRNRQHIAVVGKPLQQCCNSAAEAARKGEESYAEVPSGDTATSQATGAPDKERRSAGPAQTENIETRLATEAEQLAVKLEWIEEAYREMEKCMDRFNILGLRFANRAVSASSSYQQHYGASSNGDGKHQGEGVPAGSINARRGGGGALAAGAGAVRAAGGREGKRTGPYKPFLRKDKLANRSNNQTPPKSCYTKLHKDILHPLPPEYLKPQHCWVDLTASIAPLMEKTACILQVQLLFERIVGFPRLICLQREKLLEACRLVKLSDVLRKVQVPISFPRTTRSASSRFHTSLRPVAHASPLTGASATRGGGREAGGCIVITGAASNGRGPELNRSNSGASLTPAAGGGRGGGTAAAGRESCVTSSPSTTRLLGKRNHACSSSSRTGNGGTNTCPAQLSRTTGVTPAATQQLQQRQGAGCSSMSRLLASRGFVASSIERKRRLGLPDLDVLFYAQLQGVRRQLQLQEASFGLGLLETWYLLEPIALVCYPFFPTKAKLLEAFVNPLAAAWHEKQRSSVQTRLLRSPVHAYNTSTRRTKPRLEQMLQQLEEEDRLAFAASGEEPAAAEKVKRSRGRSRCRERTAAPRQEYGTCLEAGKEEPEPGQGEHTADDGEKSCTPQRVANVKENVYMKSSSASTFKSAPAADRATVRSPHGQPRCTGPISWGSAATGRSDAAATQNECTVAEAVSDIRSERSSQLASNKKTTPARSTGAHRVEGSGASDREGPETEEERATARTGSAAITKATENAGGTSVFGGKISFRGQTGSEYAKAPAAARGPVQGQCLSPVNCRWQQQRTRLAGKAAQQQQMSFVSAASVQLSNHTRKDGDCFTHISTSSAAPPADGCIFGGETGARVSSVIAAVTAEPCTAGSLHCGESHTGEAAEHSELQKTTRQPLLFLWGPEQHPQRSFVDERDISTVSSQPSAQPQSDNYQTSHALCRTTEAASFAGVAAASSCAGWSVAAGSEGAAAAESARALQEKEEKEENPVVASAEAPLHGAGATTDCYLRRASSSTGLHVYSTRGSETRSHSGSSRGTTSCSLVSAQEGKGEEETSRTKDLPQAASCRISGDTVSATTAAGTATPAAAAATSFEIPDWHAGLCAAWPEDLWSYIRRDVPTQDRLAAMKKLVDYFHLRLDYCSFSALLPGGAGGSKM